MKQNIQKGGLNSMKHKNKDTVSSYEFQDIDNKFINLIRSLDNGEDWAKKTINEMWNNNTPNLILKMQKARIIIYKEDALRGDENAQYWYGQSLQGINNAESKRILMALANKGNVKAMEAIALAYSEHGGYENNHEESIKWRTKAAEAGDVDSQCAVALEHVILNDYDKAYYWYHRAAQQNSSEGFCGLAKCYEHRRTKLYGQGHKADDKEVMELNKMIEDAYFNAYDYVDSEYKEEAVAQGLARFYSSVADVYHNKADYLFAMKSAIYFYVISYQCGNPYSLDNAKKIASELNITVDYNDIDRWAVMEGIQSNNQYVDNKEFSQKKENYVDYGKNNNINYDMKMGTGKNKSALLNKKTVAVCIGILCMIMGGLYLLESNGNRIDTVDSTETYESDNKGYDDYNTETLSDETMESDEVELDYDGCLKTAMEYVTEGDFEAANNTLDVILNQVQDDELSIARIDILILQDAEKLYAEGKVASAYERSMEISEDAQPEIFKYSREICSGCFANLDEIIAMIENKEYSGVYGSLDEFFDFCIEDFYYQDGKIVDGNSISEKGFYADASGYIYYGYFVDGLQDGKGVEIGRFTDGEYYRLTGTFANDFANGKCTLEYPYTILEDGMAYKETIKGNFTDGYEDGNMTDKFIQLESGEEDSYEHVAKMGEYEILRYEDGEYVYHDNGEYYQWYSSEDDLKGHGAPRRKTE